MTITLIILATATVGMISFTVGWKIRDRRAAKEIAQSSYMHCGFLIGCRKVLNESRLDELRDGLTMQARSHLRVWESLDGVYPVPKFNIDRFVQQAREEFPATQTAT